MWTSLRKLKHQINDIILKNYFYSSSKYLKSQNLESRQKQILQKGLPKVKPIENVKNIVIIASGKGGVGKSTTAVNLVTALKLLAPNKNVGILDADIFGPSLPLMMNLNDEPLVDKDKKMLPLNNYGVKCMSMGFLIEEGAPVIWRGLMVMQALEKLMRGVNWGPTDYLIIDTPPGTGDTHLSLIQNLPIDGVILVTTPQNAALQVAKRGAIMFQKLKVPIIGLVENMSFIECPKCSNKINLFGSSTRKLADEINVDILQQIPISSNITTSCDKGTPIVITKPNEIVSTVYKNLAEQVITFLENKNCK